MTRIYIHLDATADAVREQSDSSDDTQSHSEGNTTIQIDDEEGIEIRMNETMWVLSKPTASDHGTQWRVDGFVG